MLREYTLVRTQACTRISLAETEIDGRIFATSVSLKVIPSDVVALVDFRFVDRVR